MSLSNNPNDPDIRVYTEKSVKELLFPENDSPHWTQRACAKNSKGEWENIWSHNASCFCMQGGILIIYPPDISKTNQPRVEARKKAVASIRKLFGDWFLQNYREDAAEDPWYLASIITNFNDSHTIEEVKAVVVDAGI